MIKIPYSKNILDDKNITLIEQECSIKLPNDFCEFLKKHHGVSPENNIFEFPEHDNNSGVNSFLSNREIVQQKKALSKRIPADSIPIAYAEGGNLVLLVVGENAGIYFWDHEFEVEEYCLPSFDNLFLISRTFDGFIEQLREFDINSIELKSGQVGTVWLDPDFKPEF